jgi:hypothetical protein
VFLYYVYLEYKYGENDSNEKSRNTYSSYTLERFADAMLSFTSGAPIKQMAKIHTFIIPDLEGFKFHTHGGIFNILKDTMVSSKSFYNNILLLKLVF